MRMVKKQMAPERPYFSVHPSVYDELDNIRAALQSASIDEAVLMVITNAYPDIVDTVGGESPSEDEQ